MPDQMVGLSQSQGCQQEPWACHLPLVGEVTDQDVACVEEFDSHPDEIGACEEWWGLDSGTGIGSEDSEESIHSEPVVEGGCGDAVGQQGRQGWQLGAEMVVW